MKKQFKSSKSYKRDIKTEWREFLELISIIAVMGVIILAIYLSPFVLKDNYKITINECHNKTKQLPCVKINLSLDDSKGIFKERIIVKYACPSYYIDTSANITNITINLPQEEVCEQKEVDEIYIKCFNEIGDLISCDSIPQDNIYEKNRNLDNNGIAYITKIYGDKIGFYHAYYIKLIKKSDLTKQWLSHCECLERKYPGYYEWQKYGCDKYNFKSACDNLNTNYHKCLKYKCGDYEVEVI